MATKTELQEQLDKAGIAYLSTATKDELEALLPATVSEEGVPAIIEELGLPELEGDHLHVTEVVLNGKRYKKILNRSTGVTTMELITE